MCLTSVSDTCTTRHFMIGVSVLHRWLGLVIYDIDPLRIGNCIRKFRRNRCKRNGWHESMTWRYISIWKKVGNEWAMHLHRPFVRLSVKSRVWPIEGKGVPGSRLEDLDRGHEWQLIPRLFSSGTDKRYLEYNSIWTFYALLVVMVIVVALLLVSSEKVLPLFSITGTWVTRRLRWFGKRVDTAVC